MSRIQTLFAAAAIAALLLGLLATRFDQRWGLTITLRQTGYIVPNSMLCYGVALFFCLFAVLYSVWTVSWSVRAASWHLALSLFLVGVFGAAAFAADRLKLLEGSTNLAMPVLVAFSFSPGLFLVIQGVFLLDCFRRALPVLRT